MKKNIIIPIAVLLMSTPLFSQKIHTKIATKICKCLEKEKATTEEGLNSCFERTLMSNLDGLYKHYDAKTIDEIDMDEAGGIIGAHLAKNCDYILDVFSDEAGKESGFIESEEDLTCLDVHQGEYYYINEVKELNVKDTTYLTITDTMYLERMRGGKTYSRLQIEWTSDCDFKLTFKDSNDPLKKALSEPGDIYTYEIIKKTPASIIVETFFRKKKYQVEFFKIK
ncbi:hypothetical protein [Dokdonia sp.]|uniref:hypothetical protein n=1 Tax=Dokdonia sp. TaxID=2024995 RepID=UPI00326562E8